MTNHSIPNEAVEAAARVLRAQDDTVTYPYPVAEYRDEATAILEAAALYIQAEAWDRCVESDTPWINPYRGGPSNGND